MTPAQTVEQRVRKACDVVRHGGAGAGEIPYCSWPRCGCELSDRVLTTLIAQARADGAEEERRQIVAMLESAANIADAYTSWGTRDGGGLRRWVDAIRARALSAEQDHG